MFGRQKVGLIRLNIAAAYDGFLYNNMYVHSVLQISDYNKILNAVTNNNKCLMLVPRELQIRVE